MEQEEPNGSGLSTSDIIDGTIVAIAEGITGIAASDRRQWYMSIGHLLQRIRSGRFLTTLREEWEAYREKGRVKDDYIVTDQHQESLQELFEFLDGETPDAVRFSVLKKIFLTAASESISDRESVLPQQYMRICRTLTSGETLVFLAAYELAKSGDWSTLEISAARWLKEVAQTSGLVHAELVELHERNLIEKNVLTPRRHSDSSGISPGSHYRITDLGWEICRFIEEYDQSQNA